MVTRKRGVIFWKRASMMQVTITPFSQKLKSPLTKNKIKVLQINLGKRCNLACTHCHVEAGPKRTEELSAEICEQLIQLIHQFPEIQIVDLTGGAPEMNYVLRCLPETASTPSLKIMNYEC